MKIGTKSVLFGAHCFFLHPWFVAYAWWKLYGFPFDLRLWVAFFVHDIGYLGKPNMDGSEGERHPYTGAKIMSIFGLRWYFFTLYHSRFLAKKNGAQYSRLCVADKLAIVITPNWLYLPMVRATGEINEYMKDAERNSNGQIKIQNSEVVWINGVKDYVRKWVNEHKDMKEDTWTTTNRKTVDSSGVWK
jgi:hypothetical protein